MTLKIEMPNGAAYTPDMDAAAVKVRTLVDVARDIEAEINVGIGAKAEADASAARLKALNAEAKALVMARKPRKAKK
jgi:hypothetical protein